VRTAVEPGEHLLQPFEVPNMRFGDLAEQRPMGHLLNPIDCRLACVHILLFAALDPTDEVQNRGALP
jgi:hypothetical protein